MFCGTCNLNYPDHLNFCRRCGQPLVRSGAEGSLESHCCTRCGSRVVRGENFCQQCGYRVNLKSQETVIGACYHCGTSWRSGWLFCRDCGLDRDRALMPPVSAPAPPSPVESRTPTLIEGVTNLKQSRCPKCGVEAKPYSRFCESCGLNLEADEMDQLSPPPDTGSLSMPSRDRAPTLIGTAQLDPSSQPTVLDPSAFKSNPPDRLMAGNKPAIVTELKSRSSALLANFLRPKKSGVNSPAGISKNTPAEIIYIAGSPPALDAETEELNPNRGSGPLSLDAVKLGTRLLKTRAAYQAMAMIGLLLLITAVITGWWLLRMKNRVPTQTTEKLQSQVTIERKNTALILSPTDTTPAATIPQGMVYIAGGTFQMGRDNGKDLDSPSIRITVESFFIDQTEVTNEEYQKFVNATRHPAPPHWNGTNFPKGGAKFPVINVTWNDANTYAKWAGKRLPTEAEWEFAARGIDGRRYPWSNDWNPDFANAGRGPKGHIVPVGGYSSGASPFGVLDMCGNVWEWTSSELISYAGKKKVAPGKVIRGGAFDVPSSNATTTYRGCLPPDKPYDKTGFRCVRSAK